MTPLAIGPVLALLGIVAAFFVLRRKAKTRKSMYRTLRERREVDLRKALKDLEKKYTSEADSASDRINQALKTKGPTDPKAIPEWQKGMAPWYRQMIEKEPGLDIGDGLKLSGEISIKDKKAMIYLNGKF